MPNGDLASVVLEAAKKERAKQDAGQGSAFDTAGQDVNSNLNHHRQHDKGKGKGKARANGDVLTSYQDSGSTSHANSNGFLEAPSYNRAITSSPEPLTPQASHDDNDDVNEQQQRDRGAAVQPEYTQSNNDASVNDKSTSAPAPNGRQDHVKAPPPPAKKRPAVNAAPSARKLSSAFFGGGHHHHHHNGTNNLNNNSGSSSKAAKQQAARKKYTSESSMDPDDSSYFGNSDHNNEFSDFFSGNGHVPFTTPHHGINGSNNNASGSSYNAHRATQNSSGDSKSHAATATPVANGSAAPSNKSGLQEKLGKSGHASPQAAMRGPFSRMDSSRGQSLLTRRQSIGSQEGHERSHAQDPHQLKGNNVPHRRYSISGTAQRFGHALGAFGSHPNEVDDEESANDSHGENHHSPSQSRARTPHAGERHQSFWRGSSNDDNNQGVEQSHAENGVTAKGSASTSRPQQGISRRSSYRSLNIFKRSQGPGDGPNGHIDGEEGHRHPGLSRSNTQADGSALPPGTGKSRWNQLKQRLRQEKKPAELDMTLNGSELINDLSLGLISVMMLKMAFDRDEHDQHRVSLSFEVVPAVCIKLIIIISS